MAKVTITQYVCDLTGKPVAEEDHVEVEFTVNGATYALDTDKSGAAKFDKAVKPFVEVARKVKARSPRKSLSLEKSRKVRAWAVSQGIDIADRGRVPAKIVEAYENAHK